MNVPDATLTNGRYELPRFAYGALVLADPPEAGWRMQRTSSEAATADTESLAAAGCGRGGGQQVWGTCAPRDGERE